ncbi:MAG: hypothetical protein L6R38_008700 [Xanthoria sp. 2 TBL-2021]|nr:MAG: hypothetical protein L6R38_008700 [Xanthoria sp. 2 TBL-2021]
MVSKGGVALKGVTAFLRCVELLGSILILGITSYWLALLTKRHDPIPTWMKAVEGIAGGAVLYTAFAVLLTFFLGGKTFFAFLAVLLDVLFVAGMVAIAVMTRGGTKSCSGDNPPSPIGSGERTSCRLQTAVFAVAIAMALCFLLSAVLQVLLSRQHKKEKRYGPGPSNDYTSGSAKKQPFWKRKGGAKNTRDAYQEGSFGTDNIAATNGTSTTNKKQPFWKRNKKNTHDTELGTAGSGAAAGALIAEEKHRHDNRKSYETGVTGTTAASPVGAAYGGPNNRYNAPTAPHVNNQSHHANTGPELAGSNNAYQPYRHEPEMSGAGHQPHGHNPEPYYGDLPQTEHTQVTHTSEPYAQVHQGGYPHVAGQSEYPSTTFGHGNYQRT